MDHLQTKGRSFFFSKFEHSGCTATRTEVCLGPGIGIQVTQEPTGKNPCKHAEFPAQFSGPFAKQTQCESFPCKKLPVQPPPPTPPLLLPLQELQALEESESQCNSGRHKVALCVLVGCSVGAMGGWLVGGWVGGWVGGDALPEQSPIIHPRHRPPPQPPSLRRGFIARCCLCSCSCGCTAEGGQGGTTPLHVHHPVVVSPRMRSSAPAPARLSAQRTVYPDRQITELHTGLALVRFTTAVGTRIQKPTRHKAESAKQSFC